MKQSSGAKTEFKAVTHDICKLLWFKMIIVDLRVKLERNMKLYYNNKSAINIMYNS